MTELTKIYKVWWEIDNPSLPFPVLGFNSSVQLSGTRLSVRFPSHPAIQIIQRGKRFKVHPEYQDNVLLSCRINEEGKGNLTEYFKYSVKIPKQHPHTTNAICFISPENTSDTGVKKVSLIKLVEEITVTSQLSISIDEGGLVTSSPDLYGTNISCKIPIFFVDATEEIGESFNTITSHLIGLYDNDLYYVKHSSGILESDLSQHLHLTNWQKYESRKL